MTSGVPQGSVLGPLLFLVYINDLPNNLQCTCKIFADDTKLIGNPETTDLQSDINRACKWSLDWQLRFNSTKIHVMHLGTNNPEKQYYMTDDPSHPPILPTDVEKDLGVKVDRKLSFDTHIQDSISKAKSTLAVIKRTFEILNEDTFLLLYKALVRPVLEYCNTVCHPSLLRQSRALESVQRRATRLITSIQHLDYEQRLEKLDLYSLKYRRLRGDLIEAYKFNHQIYNCTPNFFKFNTQQTRGHQFKLQINGTNKDVRKNFFAERIAPAWNALPNYIAEAKNITSFKTMLDQHHKDILFQTD